MRASRADRSEGIAVWWWVEFRWKEGAMLLNIEEKEN